jgi:hypothetical protein
MKCFLAFSILTPVVVVFAWAFALWVHRFWQAMLFIVGVAGILIAIMWAALTAIDCIAGWWCNRKYPERKL